MHSDLNHRLLGLCARMDETGLDAALLLHHRDVLYYAGTARPATLLVVASKQRKATLFARRSLDRITREALVGDVVAMRGFSSVTQTLEDLGLKGGLLGIELDTTSAQLHQRVAEAFTGWDVVDVSPLVLNQRLVKDEDEIAATKRAAAVADVGHRTLAQTATVGMRELELAAQVEEAMRRAGHEGYQPLRHPGARGGGTLLMGGENLTVRGGHGLVVTGGGLSAATPYGPSRRIIRRGDLIVLDTGTIRDGYTADESRTYIVGQPTPLQRALFAVALQAEEAVMRAVLPGAAVAQLYAAAEAVVQLGSSPFFPPGSLELPGFVGHGIGLELDEPPVLWRRDDTRLQEGMVLAIEIEVNASLVETMVKVEDTIVVRSDGPEILTQAPRLLTECG